MYLSQDGPTFRTTFRTRWTLYRVKQSTYRTNWTRFRTQLKQALGKTIMRWWSYYRTTVAV